MKDTMHNFAGGVIGGIIGVAVTCAIPWLRMTWEMAAIMVTFNSILITLYLARKKHHAEQSRFPPSRARLPRGAP